MGKPKRQSWLGFYEGQRKNTCKPEKASTRQRRERKEEALRQRDPKTVRDPNTGTVTYTTR